MGASRSRYNAIVYAKFALFLAHPLAGVLLGKGTAAQTAAENGVIGVSMLMASYMRFYREEHTLAAKPH